MQDEEEIPLFPTSRDISVNPTPQFPSSSTNSPLPEFDFLSAFPSPPVTAPTAGAPSLSPSSPSPSSSSSPTSSGFFGSAPIQPTQYPSIPSHTSDFSPPSTSLPSSAKTSPAVPRTQPQAQNGPAPCNLDRVSPLPLVGTNSAGGASKGYVPTEENLEAASKFARFAVSALQFEDVPYAISNLQKALAHLTGN
ncbi:Vacuolar protein sorting-associated protein vta1 [Balamuthia mandrillaris]